MAIFGKILFLPFQSGTIVFVGVLIVFTIFEGLLHILEVECFKRGLNELVKKLYREFMIMGFISFAILLATELSTFQTDKWYDAFHFAHIVLLFIGFVFMIQSGLLTSLVTNRNRALLSYDKHSSEELIVQYVAMHNKGGLRKFVFDHGPISIPIPALREKIEYKIIQEFFVRNYNLPPEFKFANYMCRVLRHYVLSLVEVRPISWILLAGFVGLNVVRIELVDPEFAHSVCEVYPAKNLHRSSGSDAHRFLSSILGGSLVTPYAGGQGDSSGGDPNGDIAYGLHVCPEYLLRYTFICLLCIMLYLVGVLVASEVYIQRLVDKVLDQEETIQWLEDEEQRQHHQEHQEEHAADTEHLVGICALPDDCTPVPAGSANNSEAGLELTHLCDNSESGTFHMGGNPTVAAKKTICPVGHGEGKVDHPVSKPVHGAAAVRRLSLNHRVGAARGNELAVLMAAGGVTVTGEGSVANVNTGAATSNATAIATTSNHHPQPASAPTAVPAPAPHRRRMNASYRTNSLRSDGGDQVILKLDLDGPAGPVVRRLTANHRTGSLRSEEGGEGPSASASGEEADLSAGGRRLNSSHRAGSLRSDASEASSRNNNNHQKANITSHNRRFLYLRCLERIMHVEFDFHANEAKRVGYSESVVGTDSATSSMPQTPRAKSPHHHGGGASMRESLHSSHERQPFKRTTSVSSMADGIDGPTPVHDVNLVHTDMRSNFLLMKSLREEMLQQESFAHGGAHDTTSTIAAAGPGETHTHHSLFRGHLTFPTHLFHHIGGHNSHAPHTGDGYSSVTSMSETASSALPSRSASRAMSRQDSVSTFDLEHGPPSEYSTGNSFRDNGSGFRRPSAADTIHLDYRRSLEDSIDEDRTPSESQRGRGSSGRPRTFSLTFEDPPLQGQPQAQREARLPPPPFTVGKVLQLLLAFLCFLGAKAMNVLLGHHIGEEEEHVDADVAGLQKDFSQVFLFHNAELYYFCVEFSLLAQCVYLALWATNFVFIANDSYFPVLWHIALLAPVPLNFLLTKQIIFTSVMLKSIVTLDKHVANEICEDAADERNVKHRLRKVIRTSLRTMEVPRDKWYPFTHEQFDMFLPTNGDGDGLSEANMRLFLHSLQIFLTDATVKKIFNVIDFNGDGTVSWNEISPIVFPEMVKKSVQIKKQKSATPANVSSSAASFDFSIEGDLTRGAERKKKETEERKKRRASILIAANNDNNTSELSLLGSSNSWADLAGAGAGALARSDSLGVMPPPASSELGGTVGLSITTAAGLPESGDGVAAAGDNSPKSRQHVSFSKGLQEQHQQQHQQQPGSSSPMPTKPLSSRPAGLVGNYIKSIFASVDSDTVPPLANRTAGNTTTTAAEGGFTSESAAGCTNPHEPQATQEEADSADSSDSESSRNSQSDNESELEGIMGANKKAVGTGGKGANEPAQAPARTEESKMDLAAARAQAAYYRNSNFYDV